MTVSPDSTPGSPLPLDQTDTPDTRPPAGVAPDHAASAEAAATRDEPSRHLPIWASLLIVVTGLLVLGLGLDGSTRVLTRHEVLAAQPAREMLETGRWLVPQFVGEPRLVKPPGAMWLMALSMQVFSSNAEWVVRLPSVLAGILAAWLVAAMTTHWLGSRAGLLAGLLQLTSYFTLMQARLAEADMAHAAAVVAAVAAFAMGAVPVGGAMPSWSRLLPLVFWGATAAAIPLKGLGPLFVFGAIIPYILLTRQLSAWRFLLNPPGIILFAVIVGGWLISALGSNPDLARTYFQETLGRAAGEIAGRSDPWHVYLWSAPLMLLPWTPLVVIGLVAAWRTRKIREPMSLLMLCWIAVAFLWLSLAAWKHKHYLLPALPALMPFAALGLMSWVSFTQSQLRPRRGIRRAGGDHELPGVPRWRYSAPRVDESGQGGRPSATQ